MQRPIVNTGGRFGKRPHISACNRKDFRDRTCVILQPGTRHRGQDSANQFARPAVKRWADRCGRHLDHVAWERNRVRPRALFLFVIAEPIHGHSAISQPGELLREEFQGLGRSALSVQNLAAEKQKIRVLRDRDIHDAGSGEVRRTRLCNLP
jgi:hypothetical protein